MAQSLKASSFGPPPSIPRVLKRQTSIERAQACDEIWDEYKCKIESCDVGQFSDCEGLADRSCYKSKASTEVNPEALKTIMKEIRKELPKCLELGTRGSIFVRYDDDKPQFLQALLTGVADTPYESGAFLFDIYIPNEYPHTNCLVTHVTKNASLVHANNGPGGFSPNLHQDSGKVCLSLLGTWDGPGWVDGQSNVYQVLSSILWMILGAEHPYYMEPSYGGWEGTAPLTNHDPEVIEYDEEVYFGTAKWGILEQLKDPPIGFEEVVIAHFMAKKNLILSTIKSWIKKGSDSLKKRLTPVYEELKKEFLKRNKSIKDLQNDINIAKETEKFIIAKTQYLDAKIKSVGGLKLAKVQYPKAYKRFRMAPQLLKQVQIEIAEKENVLKKLNASLPEGGAAADEVDESLPEPLTAQ
jgi:baculoviral IAP repeat-containing protein 6